VRVAAQRPNAGFSGWTVALGELSDHECMHHLFMVARQLFVLEYIRISSSRAPLL
jgi:hypothetical protein